MRRTVLVLLFVLLEVFGSLGIAAAITDFSGHASTASSFISTRQYQPSFQTYYGGRIADYWPILGTAEGQEQCRARQDLIIQVAPGGCQPAVVRSDLIAEQDVPVFCQLDALKLNPLIDISEINNIRFKSNYPKEVKAVGFHPARAALRTSDKLLGSPLVSNIGYAVVILRKNANESSLPGFVNITLSAQVDYTSGNALGIGRSEFLLTPVTDDIWDRQESVKQTFWQGRYSVRAEKIEPGFADISIYRGDIKVASTRAEAGKTSAPIYLPGSYCRAGLQVAYDGFTGAMPKARLEIGDSYGIDVIDVNQGSPILDGRCIISRLEIEPSTGTTGSLSIKCSYTEGIELSLGKKVLDFAVGDEINLIDDKDKRAWTIKEMLPDGKYRIRESAEDKNERKVSKNEMAAKSSTLEEKKYSDEIDRVFNDAINAYEKVAEQYSSEKERDLGGGSQNNLYGQQALESAISLAQQFGKGYEEARLINKFLDIYADSVNSSYYKERLRILNLYDFSFASGVLYLDGKYRTIRLLSMEEPSESSYAQVFVDQNRISTNLVLKKETLLTKESNGVKKNIGRIIVDEMTPLEIKLSAYCTKEADGKSLEGGRESFVLRLNEPAKDICSNRIRLDKINVKEVAKIRLIPFAVGTNSEVNVSIGIGIEKRAIKLSPDKAKEKIENLNESIEKFEKITNSLGKVVSTLKGVCFASAGVLTVKNFLTSLKGEGIARQQIMRGDNGWTQKCNEMVSKGEKGYTTLNACFLGEANNINKDVKAEAAAIEKVNNNIKNNIEKDYTTSSGLFGEKTIDSAEAAKKYASYLRETYKGEKIGNTKIEELISKDCYEKFECDYITLRNIEQSILAKREGVSENIAKNIESELKRYEELINNNKKLAEQKAENDKLKEFGLGNPTTLLAGTQNKIIGDVKNIDSASLDIKNVLTEKDRNLKKTITFNVNGFTDPRRKISFEGGTYVAGLQESVNEEYIVRSMVRVNKNGAIVQKIEGDALNSFNSVYSIGTITSQQTVSYSNRYFNPQVRFYDTEPYKGMPALVPFDTNEGWYAATRQTLPVFGGIGAFESSGRVSSFWLCNVGKNGREQFDESGFGDDNCQLINLNTGQALSSFPGLDDAKAKQLVGRAVRALTDAANQYGNKIIKIERETFTNVKSAANVPAVQCQDFMDPRDCHLLFNACDPVICPASRCNFGGQYQVADVVQSGVIGSTLLCLPNVREKIVIPVCLTGVHAGLESYTSILKSHRDCLQENLKSGKTVGICDEITSIYMCEFFWRQGAPIAKLLLPKLIEFAYTGGQGARGGGEYLTVAGAWNNMQNSINFFTQHYAANALKAYQIRSVEEAGTQVCKNFISAKVPTNFKSLVQPDSPPQFYSWFSSIRYSDATLPATSQYKVFYHIFAGKDSGVYYRVYLKSPPESNYYYSSPIVPVAAGFIAKGEFKTETKDFTAPEGYKELCVDINGEEKCGFKEVSTDAAVNYIKDAFAKNEIDKQEIKSEKECISGVPSLSGTVGALLTNPNLQSSAEQAVFPTAYTSGIVRICSTDNPGSATNPGRYSIVGNCGDARIKCWLDTESVGKAIGKENIGLLNESLQKISEREINSLANSGGIMTQDSVNSNLKELKNKVESVRKDIVERKIGVNEARNNINSALGEMDKLFGANLDRLVLNSHKAEVLLRKAELHGLLAQAFLFTSPAKQTTTLQDTQQPITNIPKTNTIVNTKKIVSLKGTAIDGYDPTKQTYISIDGQDTKFYLEGTYVFLVGVRGIKEQIGVVKNNVIELYSSRKNSLEGYFDLINNTFISSSKHSSEGNLLLVKDESSSQESSTLKLSSSYAFGKKIDVLLNDKKTGVYLKDESVFVELGDRPSWVERDIGKIIDKTNGKKQIILEGGAYLYIFEKYFELLNGSFIAGNSLIGFPSNALSLGDNYKDINEIKTMVFGKVNNALPDSSSNRKFSLFSDAVVERGLPENVFSRVYTKEDYTKYLETHQADPNAVSPESFLQFPDTDIVLSWNEKEYVFYSIAEGFFSGMQRDGQSVGKYSYFMSRVFVNSYSAPEVFSAKNPPLPDVGKISPKDASRMYESSLGNDDAIILIDEDSLLERYYTNENIYIPIYLLDGLEIHLSDKNGNNRVDKGEISVKPHYPPAVLAQATDTTSEPGTPGLGQAESIN